MPPNQPHPGHLLSIPFLPFVDSLELQQSLVAKRLAAQVPDTLILTEHDSVLTLGRTTKPDHWEPHWSELKNQGIHLH
ncbi:MAG: hypothetical protein E4H32_07215, partial [Nitrospirales bacterium]